MPTNQGTFKEQEMVERLNNKKISELSNNLKTLMIALFGVLDDKGLVQCKLIDGSRKPDFVIIYKGQKRYISMKTGRAEVVHEEYIDTFITFLRSLGVSERTLETMLLYQYGDGTIDGSGEDRYNYNLLRVMLDTRIKEANEELNKDKELLIKVIDRCVILGTVEDPIPIDAIYFGDYVFGEVATKRQILRHIKIKNWDWMNNLHIGPIQIRPHARYIGKEIKNPMYRKRTECYWANLSSDISYISHRYDY